jgi:hypothetical protein
VSSVSFMWPTLKFFEGFTVKVTREEIFTVTNVNESLLETGGVKQPKVITAYRPLLGCYTF